MILVLKLNIPFAPFVRVLVLTAFLVTAVQSSVAAEEWQEITIINNSGHSIYAICFSTDDGNSWSEDILGDAILEDGYQIVVYYNAELARTNYYSVFQSYGSGDNDYFTWNGFDVEGATELEFNRDGTASVR